MNNRCITCKKPVNRNKAYMTIEVDGEMYLVCCPLCQSEFEKNSQKYIAQQDGKRSRHP